MKPIPRPLGALTAAAALLAGAVAVAPAAASATPAEPATVQKSLVIGVDGLAFDEIAKTSTPALDALRADGLLATSNLFANPMAPTVSGPAWATIATGTWPDKHGTRDNDFAGTNYGQFPDYLSRAEAGLGAVNTLAVGTWGPITSTIFGPAVDERIAGGTDEGTTARTVAALTDGDPDAIFVHLDEVDGAGHSAGTNGAAYGPAVSRADAQIGEILAAVAARESRAQEDWLIVVTSDHGHTPTGGHGGHSAEERKTFVLAAGGGQPAGAERFDAKLTDIAPTVLAHLGVAVDPAWEFDGANIADLRADDFDTLRGQLRRAVDEAGPGERLGWTNATPAGWRIDNSRMPEGGSTEFRGWAFMTDEFFTAVERGQGRETNVRSRDVFAVADSDEWDDRPHAAGQFDSSLIGPEIELNGAATLSVSYATTYINDGPQTGDTYLVFPEDTGLEKQRLEKYRGETVNRVEHLVAELPRTAAGALPRSAHLEFDYTGTNSMFWAVDQVRWSQPEAPVGPVDPVAWASLRLAADSVAQGGSLGVAVEGLAPGQQVAVALRGATGAAAELPAPEPADAAGTVRFDVAVPRSQAVGAATIELSSAGNETISAAFTVTAAEPQPKPDTGSGNDGGAEPGSGAPGAKQPGAGLAATGAAAESGAALLTAGGLLAAGAGTWLLLARRRARAAAGGAE